MLRSPDKQLRSNSGFKVLLGHAQLTNQRMIVTYHPQVTLATLLVAHVKHDVITLSPY
jgi:hypothetical protein